MYNVILFTDDTNNIASLPPIGAYKCAHVLRKAGYSCLVVNHFSSYTLEEFDVLIDSAVSDQTFLVGFSTTFLRDVQVKKIQGQQTPPFPDIKLNTVFPQGKEIEDLVLQKILAKNPKIKTVAGGAKVNPNYQNKNINYVCLGYSEISIVNLANHITKQHTLNKSTKNLWGVTVIDDRFAPEYHYADEDMQWQAEDIVNHKTLPIEIARGCIFRCKFCSYPMNGKQQLDFVKSKKNLRYELERNYDLYGIDQYVIIDDTFNDHEKKLDTLQEVVESLKFQPKFWGYHRLDLIATRPHTIKQLHDIGVRAMYFGIESLHPPTAKIIGKGYDVNKQIAALEILRGQYSDITLHGSFIVGLPEESEVQVTKTFEHLISQKVPLHSWQFHGLHISKKQYATYHSDIDLNYQQYGYTELENSADNKFLNWQNNHMNFSRAVNLADQFMQQSQSSDNFHVQGLLALTVATMNHSNYTFDSIHQTPFNKFNFYDIEENVRKQFIRQYKDQLLTLITTR